MEREMTEPTMSCPNCKTGILLAESPAEVPGNFTLDESRQLRINCDIVLRADEPRRSRFALG
jgi:hypothetical protein